MNVRIALISAVAALLVALAPSTMAQSAPSGASEHHVLPVLITVTKEGKVTDVKPAYRLSTSARKLVESTLRQMITGPMKKDGKAVTSQAIIQLQVETVRQASGDSKVNVSYLGARPVPVGQWHWSHRNHGRRLALQSSEGNFLPAERHAPPPLSVSQQNRLNSLRRSDGGHSGGSHGSH